MSAQPVDLPVQRDYVAEMREAMEQAANGDPAPIVAARLVAKLRATDRDLLDGWLDLQAVSIVRDALAYIDRADRAHARATTARSVFAAAAAEGDVTGWLATRHRLDDGRRPTLAEMTADDLRYVAGTYDSQAKANRMEAVFMRALAKRVGKGTVADHFTEQQIADLRRSLLPT